MKNILLISILLISNSIIAQNINIHCHFQEGSQDSCSLQLDKYHIKEFDPVYKMALVNASCLFNLNIDQPIMATLLYKNQLVKLWLEPNDDLKIKFNSNSIDIIEGKGSEQNKFLLSFMQKYKVDYLEDSIKANMLSSSIDAFENKIFEARKNQLDYFKRNKKNSAFPLSFDTYMTNQIKYHYFYQLQAYPIINANSNTGLSVTPLPGVFVDDISSIFSNNEEALNCESYRKFLAYYIVYNTSRLNGYDKFTDNSVSMESKMNFTNQSIQGKSKVYSIATYLNDHIQEVKPFTAKKTFDLLSLNENKGIYTKLLKPKYEKEMKTKGKSKKRMLKIALHPEMMQPKLKYWERMANISHWQI